MGSTHLLWILITVLCGIFYLLFDALRSFALQLSPVRLRRLSANSEEDPSWTHFDVEDFQLVSGVLLQISIVIGLASTTMLFEKSGIGSAILKSAAIWAATVVIWKFVLALIPEDTGEIALRALIPVSRVSYFVFWPILFPLRKLLERLERAEQADDEEESEVEDEDVQAYINVGEEEGIIERSEGKLLQSIVDFGDRLVHEIMTPRIDVDAFDAHRPIEELATLFSESKYSRIPVYEESIDKITGIVHIKEVFDAILRVAPPTSAATVPAAEVGGATRIMALARPPYFVPGTKKVSELMRELQSEHLEIAIVVDEYGGTAGIITLEDIVEEIIGEIADEHEEEEATVVDLGDGNYLVNGMLRVEELEEKLDANLIGDDYETVAGLIVTTLGRIPKNGEKVTKNGYRFEVERADRRRIYRVRVSRDPEWREEEEGEGEA